MKTRVLFLCTGNSCRSQMAEALLRHVDRARFEAISAGSHPAGYVHPLASGAMARMGVPMTGHRSKSWDEYAGTAVDVVITVCEAAAQETCPVWPGRAMKAYWPLPDPVFYPGTDAERLQFALAVAQSLRAKIEGLVALDFAVTPESELQVQLARVGEL